MTKTNDDVEKFLQLRAQGWSFDRIAAEINVSKPVLLKWSKQYQQELDQQSYFELQNIIASHNIMRMHRMAAIAKMLGAALVEVETRAQDGKLSDMATDKLINLVLTLETRLEKETERNRLDLSDGKRIDYMLSASVDVD